MVLVFSISTARHGLLLDVSGLPPSAPTYLHKSFTFFIRRVPHKILIEYNFTLRIQHNDSTSSVVEGTQALSSLNVRTDLYTLVILDCTYEHSANRDNCNGRSSRSPLKQHH